MSRSIAVVVMGVLPVTAVAVPLSFTHQARVLDGSGSPINGAHEVTIALYDAAGATTPVWDETQTVVLQDGYFSVRLGTDPLDPLDTDTIVDGGSLWVGIRVDSGAELPVRTEVGSTLYAMRADVATDVDGGTVNASSVDAGSVAVTGTVTAAGVQVGDSGSTCTGAQAGTVRFASGTFQGCDGSQWHVLSVDNDTLPTSGDGISVSGAQVSLDATDVSVRRRIARYQAICTAQAVKDYPSYETVAAVTPGSSSVTLTGSQVCGAYIGNNGRDDFVCISVPYVYNDVFSPNGDYFGTDVRPRWSSCSSPRGPNHPTTGNYPWLDPVANTGSMMACCVNPN